jgi:tryptophan synthase alpha chain
VTEPAKDQPGRIENCFLRLGAEKRKGFIPYICAGDPNLELTVELSLAMAGAGADILELGLPFSDPLADGIVNQLAAQRALSSGTTVRGVLDAVGRIRKQSDVPIVLYTYLNPIIQFGFEPFHEQAAKAGVDALLILDLPPEEDSQVSLGLSHIRLIAPTTSPQRMAQISKNARGFLYYVSREGVTGARENLSTSIEAQITKIRNCSNLPIAVGFGISSAEQARMVAQHADAVVIGSAIVDRVAKKGADCIADVTKFVREITAAIR